MKRVRCFAEVPAGLASVSLRLHGGPHCRPPISRMGNKAGYAEVILAALGLRSGQGAGAYVWCEADADVRGLLRAYPDAAMLRRVAEIIRGWADEEPRALWERLRAERKARGPRVDEEGTASWAWIQGHGSPDGRLAAQYLNPDGNAAGSWAAPPREWLADRCLTLAEYATIASSNRLIHVADDGTGDLRNTGQGGTTFGGAEFATPAGDVAAAFERAAGDLAAAAAAAARTMPQANARGATDGDFLPRIAPSGVVRYAPDAPAAGFDALAERVAGDLTVRRLTVPQATARGETDADFMYPHPGKGLTPDGQAERCGAIASRWPPVAVLPTIPTAADLAAMLGTPGDLEGVVVYSDPPYVGTTGYAADLPRADVVRFALDCDALGAVVCVSEAEVLSELIGWHAVEITAGRKGQKRTFSRQQGEWLTMNREPAHRVATQPGLFTLGGAA